jgi:hypothetical protein
MKENPSPHQFKSSKSIERSIKRGFKLSQTVKSPQEIVIPVELEFFPKKLGPECRLLKPFHIYFKHVFESPEEDRVASYSSNSRQVCDFMPW